MFDWQSLFGQALDGAFGSKVKRVVALFVLASIAATPLVGVDWGVRLLLNVSMREACDQVIPLFNSLVVPSLHASKAIVLACPHMPLPKTYR